MSSPLPSELSSLPASIQKAYYDIHECLNSYRPEELSIAFNGGKDSIVLLHLIDMAFKNKAEETKQSDWNICNIVTLYFVSEKAFEEVNHYVEKIVSEYNLQIYRITAKGFKAGLQEVKQKYPKIKAIFMGTRKGDPCTENSTLRSPTDNGWPEFMRLNPILNIEYDQVWKYIEHFKIPYCSLYTQGYTSIGETNNTVPNPDLFVCRSEDGKCEYKHARLLTDSSKERDGRK